jgi:hypothetical protein
MSKMSDYVVKSEKKQHKSKSKSEEVQFTYYDRLFNNGQINFTFNKNIFLYQPKIKFV